MGACLSSVRGEYESESERPTSAKVVSLRGDLLQYKVPVSVSQVLQADPTAANCFLCNSDNLLYDEHIPALDWDEQLEANQIYFVLPNSKLVHKLSASDMAALAVKASVALQTESKNSRHRRKKSKISPVLPINQASASSINGFDRATTKEKSFNNKPAAVSESSIRLSRSGSVRKLKRYSSRRAKLAVRSFRLRLATIYEGSVA
ncbi:uncharacterized protein LOC123229051 [Mangifera indica]|uniref:uncharacterized protein LOC123229051 n=1 Tax=Mangifera indica TaxID=29780 RepID=UPI001CFA65DD|nr:uncharacterized protein LOC123229051 [Mangifera indica]